MTSEPNQDIDESCRVCKKEDQEEYLVFCDGCDNAYHTFCKNGCTCCGEKPKGLFGKKPPVPEGDWFCKNCIGHPPVLAKKQKEKSIVYAWGDNECGQLGVESKEQNVYEPAIVEQLKGIEVSLMACGEDFTVVGTSDGEVYSFGNGVNGRLGHGDIVHEALTKPRNIDGLDIENRPASDGTIAGLYCGNDFCVAVTSTRQLYTWGGGESGQLGHQENKDRKVPKKVSALRELEVSVDLVACGADFVLMTSADPPEDEFVTSRPGVFMAMGSNNHGQLGDASGRNQWVPQLLNSSAPEETPNAMKNVNVSTNSFSLGRDVIAIAAGKSHSVALTRKGACYSWGYGELGQLGHEKPPEVPGQSKFFKPQFRVPRPRYIEAFEDVLITSIVCGGNHTLALATSGKLYAWGSNKFGQVGSSLEQHIVELPKSISQLSDVEQMACGEDHSIVKTKTGIFAFGRAKEGQCGVGKLPDKKLEQGIDTPMEIPNIPIHVELFCGGHQSFAINTKFLKKVDLKRRPSSSKNASKKRRKKK